MKPSPLNTQDPNDELNILITKLTKAWNKTANQAKHWEDCFLLQHVRLVSLLCWMFYRQVKEESREFQDWKVKLPQEPMHLWNPHQLHQQWMDVKITLLERRGLKGPPSLHDFGLWPLSTWHLSALALDHHLLIGTSTNPATHKK